MLLILLLVGENSMIDVNQLLEEAIRETENLSKGELSTRNSLVLIFFEIDRTFFHCSPLYIVKGGFLCL